jgi:hypothetical protein
MSQSKQRPRRPLYIRVILGEAARQPNEAPGNFAMVLMHWRHASVNRRGNREILVGDFPDQFRARRRLNVRLAESGDLAKAVQYQLNSFTITRFPQILLNPRGTPK